MVSVDLYMYVLNNRARKIFIYFACKLYSPLMIRFGDGLTVFDFFGDLVTLDTNFGLFGTKIGGMPYSPLLNASGDHQYIFKYVNSKVLVYIFTIF